MLHIKSCRNWYNVAATRLFSIWIWYLNLSIRFVVTEYTDNLMIGWILNNEYFILWLMKLFSKTISYTNLTHNSLQSFISNIYLNSDWLIIIIRFLGLMYLFLSFYIIVQVMLIKKNTILYVKTKMFIYIFLVKLKKENWKVFKVTQG